MPRSWNFHQSAVISHSQETELIGLLCDWLFSAPLDVQRERYEYLYATFSSQRNTSPFCAPSAFFRDFPLRYSAIQYCIDANDQICNGNRLKTFLGALGVVGSLVSSRTIQISNNHIYQWQEQYGFLYHPKPRTKFSSNGLFEYFSEWIRKENFDKQFLEELELGVFDS